MVGEEIDPAAAEASVFSGFKSWLMSLDQSAKKDRDARSALDHSTLTYMT